MNDNKALERAAEIISALKEEARRHPDIWLYRDAADLIEQLTAEPPNDPLTLEELREVTQAKLLQDGTILYQRPTPVWLDGLGTSHDWAVITMVESLCVSFKTLESDDEWSLRLENYGKTWLAYRYKPDGGGE